MGPVCTSLIKVLERRMEEIAAIVKRIIAEHKVILAEFKSLEKVGNDATALKAMEKGKDVFMPGRLDPAGGLNQLEAVRQKLDKGLQDHFHWEEITLLDVFNDHKAYSLVQTLKTLMSEHEVIRDRLGELKGLVQELQTEHLSRQIWETKGYDLRARMTSLQKTVEAHALTEQELLNDLLKQNS